MMAVKNGEITPDLIEWLVADPEVGQIEVFELLSNLKRTTDKTTVFLLLSKLNKLPKVATAWRSIALALDLREVVPALEVTI